VAKKRFNIDMKRYFNEPHSFPGRVVAGMDSPEMVDFFGNHKATNLTIVQKFQIMAKVLPGLFGALREAERSYLASPCDSKMHHTRAEPGFISKIEDKAKSLGISAIGYANVTPARVYKGYAVPHEHAIVLVKEMDKVALAKAPSIDTEAMVMNSYRDINGAANVLVTFLREHEHAAEAGPGLGGITNYVLLARDAGLGWIGRHGMLITPQHGPRQRLAIVYTGIDNLPIPSNARSEHEWISAYCATCGKCIRKCPVNAILDSPVQHSPDHHSHVNSPRCHEYFRDHFGCSICMKECPFNLAGYDAVKKAASSKRD
jgi:epoxyqueuosine reductase